LVTNYKKINFLAFLLTAGYCIFGCDLSKLHVANWEEEAVVSDKLITSFV
jgi:hypothetical protein